MDQRLTIERGGVGRVAPASGRAVKVAASPPVVPGLDLLLAIEADAIVELAMRVEADDDKRGRRDVNRRAALFARLFERWRETEGLEEGGTWPVPAPAQDGLEQADLPGFFR